MLKSSLIGEGFVVHHFKSATERPEELQTAAGKITTAAAANYGSETYFIYIHRRRLYKASTFLNSFSHLTLDAKQSRLQISESASSFTSKPPPTPS